MLASELLDTWAYEEGGLYTSGFVPHRYFTKALEGLVPPTVPIENGWSVLDANCGHGAWVLDLRKLYPDCRITGIDSTETLIKEARRMTSLSGLISPDFQVVDFPQIPHIFHKKLFDLVYMRNASARIQASSWPDVITGLVETLRPGGWINLVEYEPGPTSSEAFNQLLQYGLQVLQRSQRTFPPSSSGIGVAARLYGFLQQSQIPLIDVSYTVHAVEMGFNNSQHGRAFLEAMLALAASSKPIVIQLEPISPRSFDALVAQAREELFHPYSCGYGTLFSAVGCKED